MKKSLKKNLLFDFSYRIVNVLVPLITAPYISRVIGVGGIGEYSYTQSVVGYFTVVAALGTIPYGQREIAYCKDSKNSRSKVFLEIFFLRTIVTVIVWFAFLCFVQTKDGIVKTLFLIQMLDFFGGITDITWLYQGSEEFGFIAIRNITMRLLSVFAIFLFVKEKNDLCLYVAIVSMSIIVSNILLFCGITKYVTFNNVARIEIFKHIKPMISLFVPTIALSVYSQVDKTMLWDIGGSASENGYYEQATKVIIILITVVSAIGNVAAPRTARLYINKDTDGIKKITLDTIKITLYICVPIVFGMMAVAAEFVNLFFGNGYEKVGKLLTGLSVICIPMAIKYAIGNQYLIPIKQERIYNKSLIIGLIVNVVLNALLIEHFMSMGAVIASVASEITIVSFLFYKVRDTIKIKQIIKDVCKYLVSASLMFVIVCIVGKPIENIVSRLILKVVVGVFVYYGLMLLFCDELTYTIIRKLFRKNKKGGDNNVIK